MRCESSGSVQSESPGGANLPSLPSAHSWLLREQRGINGRRGGSVPRNRDTTSHIKSEGPCVRSGIMQEGGHGECVARVTRGTLSTCCLMTPETHP